MKIPKRYMFEHDLQQIVTEEVKCNLKCLEKAKKNKLDSKVFDYYSELNVKREKCFCIHLCQNKCQISKQNSILCNFDRICINCLHKILPRAIY